MSKVLVFFFLFFATTTVYSENLHITEFRDQELDLFHPSTGEYVKTLASEGIPTPIAIDQELTNGTYLITLGSEQLCVDSGAVKTNKVLNIDNIQDCNNTVKTNHVAASRGLGKGCIE